MTSLVRTVEQQKKLRRHNGNAAPEDGDTASTHLTGMTVDILKRGLSRKEHQWIQEYFLPLNERGVIDPIEERRQPVFHVTVFNSYNDRYPIDIAPRLQSVTSTTLDDAPAVLFDYEAAAPQLGGGQD